MRKRAKVIMLPTDEPTLIVKFKMFGKDKINYSKVILPIQDEERYQHLYITDDSEIRDGDYCYYENRFKGGKLVCIAKDFPSGRVYHQIGVDPIKEYGFVEGGITPLQDEVHKIIATTDVDMCDPRNGAKDYTYRQFPQPSKAFIKKYCEVGGIDEVDVEFNEPVCMCDTFEKVCNCPFSSEDGCTKPHNGDFYGLHPKVDSHNTITIHPIKDSWSREEVESLCKEAFSHGVRLWEDWEREDWEMWEKFKKENL